MKTRHIFIVFILVLALYFAYDALRIGGDTYSGVAAVSLMVAVLVIIMLNRSHITLTKLLAEYNIFKRSPKIIPFTLLPVETQVLAYDQVNGKVTFQITSPFMGHLVIKEGGENGSRQQIIHESWVNPGHSFPLEVHLVNCLTREAANFHFFLYHDKQTFEANGGYLASGKATVSEVLGSAQAA